VNVHERSADEINHRGVSFRHKAHMWLVHSGARNAKERNPDVYKNLVEVSRMQSVPASVQIDKDLARTFPGHPLFQEKSFLCEKMKRILEVYSLHDSNVGYCQGMNFLVGFLLLFMEEEDCFWTLDAIVEKILPTYYDTQMLGVQVDNEVLTHFMRVYLPDISSHLEGLGVTLSLCSIQWFLCLFVNNFPAETTIRLWDSVMCKGRDTLIAVALGILSLNESQILSLNKASDVYDMLKAQPKKLIDWKSLFEGVWKHFYPLFESDKVREKHHQILQEQANKRDILRIQKQTHFNAEEIEALRGEFSKYAKNESCVTKEKFYELIARLLPFGKNTDFADDLFKVFDKSGDGLIDFREFSIGLSIFTKGSMDEKLEMCFKVFDENGDGYIQPEEFSKILDALYRTAYPGEDNAKFVKSFVQFAFRELDVNHDGKFSLEEFKEIVFKQPVIMQCFRLTSPSL